MELLKDYNKYKELVIKRRNYKCKDKIIDDNNANDDDKEINDEMKVIINECVSSLTTIINTLNIKNIFDNIIKQTFDYIQTIDNKTITLLYPCYSLLHSLLKLPHSTVYCKETPNNSSILNKLTSLLINEVISYIKQNTTDEYFLNIYLDLLFLLLEKQFEFELNISQFKDLWTTLTDQQHPLFKQIMPKIFKAIPLWKDACINYIYETKHSIENDDLNKELLLTIIIEYNIRKAVINVIPISPNENIQRIF
jgi:hypothetical protein